MSRKNVLDSYKIFDNISLSTQTSNPTNVKYLDYGSIHILWTGSSPVGSVSVQVRNGENDSFYTLDIGPAPISGSSGDHVFIFNSLDFYELKLVYTHTSGSGNLTANFIAKQN